MLPGFEKIVEERIQAALRRGAFDRLEGRGEPLRLEDDSHIPEELRLAYKMLKNAGYTPPEIELKKEIRRTEELLEGMTETAEKYRLLKKLNLTIMRLNMMRNTSMEFELPQQYAPKLLNRFAAGKATTLKA
jgi:hypothetical protein